MKILAVHKLSKYRIFAQNPLEDTYFTVSFAIRLQKADLILILL